MDAQAETNIATRDDPRWIAVTARDRSQDGIFYYSVATTGVYCRPSCASRRANPKNVRFHATAADAERAGFRPCKRCRPNAASGAQEQAAMVAEACRRIEAAEEPPSLADLALAAGLSPHHFHRVFRACAGVTPKAYANAHRAGRVREALSNGAGVTRAIYDAGYNSSSRFYEHSDRILGMRPTDYRAGGTGAEIRFAIGECSLGAILVAASAKGVCAIMLGDEAEVLARGFQDRFPLASLIGGDADFERMVAKVVALVEAPAKGLDLPLDVRGTAFQQRVWQALQALPAGATASYRDIAERIGAPGSARAVAQACASNTLAVAIPCHRVIRTDGGLSGYRWGVERKRALLAREGARLDPASEAA